MLARLLPLIGIFILLANVENRVSAQQDFHVFHYDPATGNLSLKNEGRLVTALQIDSKVGVFTGARPPLLDGLFNVYRNDRLFLLEPFGFEAADFGPIVTPGLTRDFLLEDLSFSGAVAPNGGLGQVLLYTSKAMRVLHYDSQTGAMSLDVPVGADGEPRLTSVVIDSASGIFTGERPDALDGAFDVFRADRVFKMDVVGMDIVNLGKAASSGLDASTLEKDLCIAGSVIGGGTLTMVRLNSIDGPIIKPCDVLPEFGGDLEHPNGIYLEYDPATGRLLLETNGLNVTAIELLSTDEIFTGQRPAVLFGAFDVFTPTKLFKLQAGGGFQDLDFGFAMAPGLSNAQIQGLRISGAIYPQGGLGEVTVRYGALPEPNSAMLLALGGCGLIRVARRRAKG